MSSERPDGGARRSRPPARRDKRRTVGVGLLVACVVAAFLIGAGIGYVIRGAPSSGDSVTVEREVPVVTVTVESPSQ